MEYVYAVTSVREFAAYQSFANKISYKFREYLCFLAQEYHVINPPKCIVLASANTATQRISNIPIPAYTNDFRTVFCPNLSVWRDIYLMQLDDKVIPEIRCYYETELTENHVLQILGHEFVHHSDLFIEEAYEKTRWFEEGMCEYISRKYFLTDIEFQNTVRINALLANYFESQHGPQQLESFSADTYAGTYAAIFYFYWKSFLAIDDIVQRFDGNVQAVFQEYKRWFDTSPSTPLSEWFLSAKKDIL